MAEYGMVLSPTELEGVSPAADWSRWIGRGKAPDSKRGTSSTSFATSWAEDLEQLASLGASTVMLTMEWAELEPHQGQISMPAVEFRLDLLRTATELGMAPWICLVDQTLPGWFAEDKGGFEDDNARSLVWPRHVDWIGETFGDLAKGWIPQREPLLRAIRGNLFGAAPPGRHDPVVAAKAVRAAMLADGEAWRLLRGTAPVATYQTARLIFSDPEDPKSAPMASGLERMLWHPWLSAIGEGRMVVGDLPTTTVDHMRDGFDRVVVELRPSVVVDAAGRWHPHPSDITPGQTGLAPWPQAMAEAANRVTEEVDGRPVIIAGNLADVIDDGRARPDHQQAVLEIVEDQSLAGWWQSSPIDGYHLEHGFNLQPGLISIDRSETPAAEKYRAAAST